LRWLAAAACLGLAACGARDDASDLPNIVLVTLDTTRADHLGLYGYFRDTSPRIDAFAEQALVFERAIVPMATTLPTHVSILTATYPLEHGVMANLEHDGRRFVSSPGVRSFAEASRAAGYRTAAFVSAAPLKRGSGVEAGFDAQRDDPFFLWVHYYDAHWPFMAPDNFTNLFRSDAELERWLTERRFSAGTHRPGVGPEETRATLDAYDAELRFQDTHVGRLLDALAARDDWSRTAVVLAGDHGEGLSQHDHAAHGGTWNEQLHAPLLMRVPGEAPRRIAKPVSTVDALPTLLGRLELPGFASFLDQTSGRDVLLGAEAGDPVFSQDVGRKRGSPGYRYALTTARWKYFRHENGAPPREELYDRDADPFELTDVSREHEDVLAALRGELTARLEAQRARATQLRGSEAPRTRAADPAIQEQLRALGYLEDEATEAERDADVPEG
jgi:arylsulfatase A-like enzyme